MKVREVEYEVRATDLALPDDVKIGDVFEIVGTARVLGVEERDELVNVSSGYGEDWIPGSRIRRYTVLLKIRSKREAGGGA